LLRCCNNKSGKKCTKVLHGIKRCIIFDVENMQMDKTTTIKIDRKLADNLKKLRISNKIGTIKHFVNQAIIEKLKKEKL